MSCSSLALFEHHWQNLSAVQRQRGLDVMIEAALCPKVVNMAKRKKRRSAVQRRRLDEPYNVDYFARKHDISPEQARELMRKLTATATSSTRPLQSFFAGRTAEDAIFR